MHFDDLMYLSECVANVVRHPQMLQHCVTKLSLLISVLIESFKIA